MRDVGLIVPLKIILVRDRSTMMYTFLPFVSANSMLKVKPSKPRMALAGFTILSLSVFFYSKMESIKESKMGYLLQTLLYMDLA